MTKLFAKQLCTLVLVSLAGCHAASNEDAKALRSRLETTPPASSQSKTSLAADAVRGLYQARQYRPIWIARGKATSAADDLIRLLGTAEEEGLDPQEYRVDQLQSRLKAVERGEAAMDLEIELSRTLLQFASHLALGHPVAKQIDPTWDAGKREIDVTAIVADAVEKDDLDALPKKLAPAHPEYARLKQLLQRYRTIAAEGKLKPIPEDLKIGTGDQSPALADLRNNLAVLGDLPTKGDTNVYKEDVAESTEQFKERSAAQPEKPADPEKIAAVETVDGNLVEAIKRFEARHGLNPDGVPDPAMIAAMNVPAQTRVRQIELNMERWRWLPDNLGSPYVFVNVAGFRLQVRDADEAVPLKMRVIVGKDTNRTPIFSDTMTEVVFSPYWNIPQSIEAKEMIPDIQKDPDFLDRKNIEVIRIVDGKAKVVKASSVDWEGFADAKDLQLRQKPGADNALGYVKFLFPNRHAVYLHDTPNDNLFDKLTRDLSHGCVRLEEPVKLASYVLKDQPEWTPERIEEAMHSHKEKHVALKKPLQVHLVYLTARIDEDGVPQFFEDVYGYDMKQQEALSAYGASAQMTGFFSLSQESNRGS